MKTALATAEPPPRAVRCRYRRRNQEMCTNEAADQTEDALIILCHHHIARAMQMVKEQITAAAKADAPTRATRRTA